MRTPIVAGNWKMHKTVGEGVALASELVKASAEFDGCKVVLCPPFTAVAAVANAVKGSPIEVGGQDVHWEAKGAYTGEVSCEMLLDVGCSWVIIGHSERRAMFGETDDTVNFKVKAALASGLRPIVCVGESLQQREQGLTFDVVVSQVKAAFGGVPEDQAVQMVVAYEPIWAIGTGRASSGADAQEVCARIRSTLASLYGAITAETIRIQYGGSVKPGNMAEFAGQPDIDGALVGGASLNAQDFCGIIKATLDAVKQRQQ
ncbi:MAG: triose-phosphate isomerase [Bacillota bacterium]|jgi:triosephosphate isomerase|nr:triose-phosphate isomerase [Bacillota bacterium]